MDAIALNNNLLLEPALCKLHPRRLHDSGMAASRCRMAVLRMHQSDKASTSCLLNSFSLMETGFIAANAHKHPQCAGCKSWKAYLGARAEIAPQSQVRLQRHRANSTASKRHTPSTCLHNLDLDSVTRISDHGSTALSHPQGLSPLPLPANG